MVNDALRATPALLAQAGQAMISMLSLQAPHSPVHQCLSAVIDISYGVSVISLQALAHDQGGSLSITAMVNDQSSMISPQALAGTSRLICYKGSTHGRCQ